MSSSEREHVLYNAIIIACIISIVLTTLFFSFMKNKISKEGSFAELYFVEHKDLPRIMEINETYNISITLSNKGLVTTQHIFEVDSRVEKFRENISLSPREEAVITLSITPLDKGWKVESNITREYENNLDILKDTLMAGGARDRLIIDNRSLTNYVPISHNVAGFGNIFHTNLSVDELREKPFNKFYKLEEVNPTKSMLVIQNITLFAVEDELFLNSRKLKSVHMVKKEPFTVKLFKYDEKLSKVLEIYFWYEVR